jgi:esterase/lipase superfamily enzyme
MRPRRPFADAINAKLAHSRSKDIVVYVHGYKVPFENPLLVATELRQFISYLRRRTAAERIHVVGVSSGASVSDSC